MHCHLNISRITCDFSWDSIKKTSGNKPTSLWIVKNTSKAGKHLMTG